MEGIVEYERPVISDYGDLVELTRASGAVGNEDGVGKTVGATVPGVGGVSVGVLP